MSNTPFYEEDVAAGWARLLRECAEDHGAPNFAWHLAERGLTPASIHTMAATWRTQDHEPAEFADTLETFAAAVKAISKTDGRAFRSPEGDDSW